MNTKQISSFEIYQKKSRHAIQNFHDFLTAMGLSHDYFDNYRITKEQQKIIDSFNEEQKTEFDKLYIPYLAHKLYSEDKDIGMRDGRETPPSKDKKGGKSKRRTKKRYLRRKRSSTITRYPS